MTDPISTEDLHKRLLEANRRGRINYTQYLDPNAAHVVKAVADLQEGLLLPDATRVAEFFRMGWDGERLRLQKEKMRREHPELELLIATRENMQAMVNQLTSTIDRIERKYDQ